MSKLADDFEEISRRLAELKAERKEALTGSSAPSQEEPKNVESVYGVDYSAWLTNPPYQGYKPSDNYIELKSIAHPEWPYAGTGFEWRKFVRS